MAMARDESSDGQPSELERCDVVPVAVVSAMEVAATRKKRSGGPKTAKGKQIASRNSTRHGILALTPTVGDETIEHWETHLAGFRQSFQPVGHVEEVLVHQLAQNRWMRARQDRWKNETIRHQIDLATCWSPEEDERAREALPQDEALWVDYDAQAVLEALEALAGPAEVHAVEPPVAAGVVLALELSASRHSDTGHPWHCGLEGGPIDGDETQALVQLEKYIEEAVAHRSVSRAVVLADARAEADAAALFQANRQERERHARALRISSAYVLSDNDGTKDLRYGSQLEREFDRTLKHFETIQLARQKLLPPPIRLEVNEA